MGLASGPIRACAGIGLKPQHYRSILEDRPAVGWFEAHAENFMMAGAHPAWLDRIRRDYGVALHGVALSLGSSELPDAAHLAALVRLAERCEPRFVSEHLAWSALDGVYLNDLLPLPYTREALDVASRNVGRAQDALRRRLLVENPSRYVAFREEDMDEAEFLRELVLRTGCGLLLDVNNLWVSACNLGFEPDLYLERIPGGAVVEFHVAGHAVERHGAATLRIDDHGSAVRAEVWALLDRAVRRFGPRDTLVEWDVDTPSLAVWAAEAAKADAVLSGRAPSEASAKPGGAHACAS